MSRMEKMVTPVAYNTYLLFVFLAYVMRRAGTFSLEDKVKMVEFLGYMAQDPEDNIDIHKWKLSRMLQSQGVDLIL